MLSSPDDGLIKNFCRNLGPEKSTIWRYTSEGDVAQYYGDPAHQVDCQRGHPEHQRLGRLYLGTAVMRPAADSGWLHEGPRGFIHDGPHR